MPLTSKGNEIRSNMEKEYGPKKSEQVFYASKNKGTISGVDAADVKHVAPDKIPLSEIKDTAKRLLGPHRTLGLKSG